MQPSPDVLPIGVLLVDDHMLVRQGIRAILEEADGIDVVGEAAAAGKALGLVGMKRPDVAILDLQMPDSGGAELCWRIMQKNECTRVLILSAFLNPYLLKACLSFGARGYLLKDADKLDIVSAVRTVATGGTVFDSRVAGLGQDMLGDSGRVFDSLTPREMQVLSLVCRGMTNNEVSSELSISLNTTKGHIKVIMRKLDCRNRVELVVAARKHYLI